jgi:DNA-binding transcriptional LysR family regulator
MNFHLEDLLLFTRVAELGTLSAAAREKDVPVSHVTRSLARLEAACGVRLVHRTTHGLSLTDEGDTFLSYGKRLLETADELSSELTGKINGPSGWVRVGVSPSIAQTLIAPSLVGLREKHPDIHVDIAADDRIADMARDGIDIAIRTGSAQSDLLVARQIGIASRSLYASPSYLHKHGTPKAPDDLNTHKLIANSRAPAMNNWQRLDEKSVYQVKGQARTDNSAVLLSMAIHGVGITRIMDVVAKPFVQSGQLIPLLQKHFVQEAIPIYGVMLQERHRLPKIRACLDFWHEYLA